jgi:opacity protein-like surface antigen
MKKLNLSLVAVLAMSTFAVAGGDIAPVEPEVMVDTPMVVEDRGPYVGIAYGYQTIEIDRIDIVQGGTLLDEKFGSIMLDAGYKFNDNIAIEGRYWFGLSSNKGLSWRSGIPSDISIDAWGIYVKPMYPVSPSFDIYALLGYAGVDATYDIPNGGNITSDTVNGFSWGIGGEYTFSNDWSLFVDYTSIINGEDGNIDAIRTEDSLTTLNIGVNYKF